MQEAVPFTDQWDVTGSNVGPCCTITWLAGPNHRPVPSQPAWVVMHSRRPW